MIGKIMYGALGVVLCAATIFTGSYGLSAKNQNIYYRALNLQADMDQMRFVDFLLSDYPIRFYDGDHDYVVTEADGKACVEKEKAVLPTFVGTAYEVDGHYEIIVPTVEKFSVLNEMMNTAQEVQGENLDFETASYGEEEHVSVIWHEGFHAYQMTVYKESIEALFDWEMKDQYDMETALVKAVDENPKIKKILEEELTLLKEAVEAGSHEEEVDAAEKIILQYKDLEKERESLLPEDIKAMENYLEITEGTARYVESYAYRLQYGEQAWHERYIESLDIYSNGAGKYYGIGMAQAILLDRLKPDWKTGYDFSQSLSDILYEEIEE